MILYLTSFLLFLIGLYCVAVKKNLIKMIVGLVIMEYAVNLFLVSIGYRWGGRDPIVVPDIYNLTYVSPLPQALVVCTIIIGLSTTIIAIAMAMRIYEKYGTFDITKIRKLKG